MSLRLSVYGCPRVYLNDWHYVVGKYCLEREQIEYNIMRNNHYNIEILGKRFSYSVYGKKIITNNRYVYLFEEEIWKE